MPKDRSTFNYRMYGLRKLVLLSTCVGALASAVAADTLGPSMQSILSTMNVASGSETLQWQIAPTYSELFGLGVYGAVGAYANEHFALGVIIDYAKHREEYLANAAVQLNDSLRMIGTIGLLKESEEFTIGGGREDVRQLQYGLSLKGSYDAGIVRGFELHTYHTNAKSDTGNVETGELTGLQAMAQLQPAANSSIRLGAGYERAEWDGGAVNEGFTLQASGSQKLSNLLSIDYNAKAGQTENIFGLGLNYDLSTPEMLSSKLSIGLDRINGRNGISDDTRVAVTLTVGLGAPASRKSATTMSSSGGISTLARQDLLAEVMKRPVFFPHRVLANANGPAPATTSLCSSLGITLMNYLVSPATPENSVFVRDATGGNGRIGLRIQGQQPTNVSVAASGLAPISLNRLGDGTWFRGNLSLTAQWIGPLEVTIDNTVCLATGVRAQNP